MRMNKVKLLLLAMAISTGSILGGCSSTEEQEVVYEDLKVSTERPAKDSIANYGEFMGTVEISDTVSVVPLVSGEITETYFKEGDYVNVGDLLFTIDDTTVKQNIATAQAAYASTKSSMDRVIGSTLDQQTISATNSYKNAEIGLDTAQNNLSNIYSQIDDASSKISELKNTRNQIQDRINELTDAYNSIKTAAEMAAATPVATPDASLSDNAVATPAPTQVPVDTSQLAQIEQQIASLQSQMASIGTSMASLESSKKSLETSVHTYENQVKQAQVGVDIATVSLQETVTKVLDESVDSVNTGLNQAQVAVNNASSALKYYKITSPVSGKIDTINVDKYGMAQAGAPSYVITTDETKKIVFYVSETNINKLTEGQSVTVEYAGNKYEASISEINDSVDAATGLFKIEALVIGEQVDLYTGSSVRIEIETDRHDNILTLPLDAIYYENNQAYVYVNDNGYAKKIYVTTGLYDEEKIEIISGVDQDSEVITTWSARLKEGEKVNGVN